MLKKTLESPLDCKDTDCKDIQPVHPKGHQSKIFIGRTDAEAEMAILWPPDVKNWLTWKDPDAGKDWRQEDDRGWDGWMASPTLWTRVWVSSGSCWWTGKPGMLQPMGSERVRHNWVTELNWPSRNKNKTQPLKLNSNTCLQGSSFKLLGHAFKQRIQIEKSLSSDRWNNLGINKNINYNGIKLFQYA